METVYLLVSLVVIGGFITFQAITFPEWSWETYVGLVVSFGGCLVALIKGTI